jgi:hypothetical protein
MMGTVESADAIAEASTADLYNAASAKAERACLVMSSADAVGMTMGAVPARSARLAQSAAAECVLEAADRNTPFPGELAVGFMRAGAERVLEAADHGPPFPGELAVGFRKPPFPGELAVGFPGELKEKRGGDKEARFPDGLG